MCARVCVLISPTLTRVAESEKVFFPAARKWWNKEKKLQLYPFELINNDVDESIKVVDLCGFKSLEMCFVSLEKVFHASFDSIADSFYLISFKTETSYPSLW